MCYKYIRASVLYRTQRVNVFCNSYVLSVCLTTFMLLDTFITCMLLACVPQRSVFVCFCFQILSKTLMRLQRTRPPNNHEHTSKDFKAPLDSLYFDTAVFYNCWSVIALRLQTKVAFLIVTLTIGLRQVTLKATASTLLLPLFLICSVLQYNKWNYLTQWNVRTLLFLTLLLPHCDAHASNMYWWN